MFLVARFPDYGETLAARGNRIAVQANRIGNTRDRKTSQTTTEATITVISRLPSGFSVSSAPCFRFSIRQAYVQRHTWHWMTRERTRSIVSCTELGSRWRSTETLTTALATRTFPDSQVNRRERNQKTEGEGEEKERIAVPDRTFHSFSDAPSAPHVRPSLFHSREIFTIFSFLRSTVTVPCHEHAWERERVRGYREWFRGGLAAAVASCTRKICTGE